MQVFVINLERSTARRKLMTQQLAAQGIEFEIIKATDGAELTDSYLTQICDFEQLAKSPHLLRKGVYGCLLSHYSICQRLLTDDIPYALILEDDVVLQPNLKKLLADIEKNVKQGEVILLFSQNNYMLTLFSQQQSITLADGHQLVYPIEPWALGSAAAYVITQEAARGLVNFLLPIRHAADTWGAFYDSAAIADVRCIVPFPIKPAGFKSDIDYIPASSLSGRILGLINKYRIFPFAALLDYRRRWLLNKATDYQLVNEKRRMRQ